MGKGDTMIRIGIVEDNPIQLEHYIQLLHQQLQDTPHKIDAFTNPNAIYNSLLEDHVYNIILMDIVYEQANGIEIAKKINHDFPNIAIIFMSAYVDQAPYVYDVDHIYFIYKKDMESRLGIALEKAIQKLSDYHQTYLQIKWKSTTYIIHTKEIIYTERIKRKVKIVTQNEEYLTYMKLDDLMDTLSKQFLRVHNSFIIHTKFIKEIHRNFLIMKNNAYIPVSRGYEKSIKDLIETITTYK